MKNRNKKFTSVLAASMALSSVAPMMAVVSNVAVYANDIQNADFVKDGIAYKYNNTTVNGNYCVDVIGFMQSELNQNVTKDLTIPAEVYVPSKNTYAQVLNIAPKAFKGYTSSSLVSVTLSEGIRSIGANAFENCSLYTINFPESLESIGDWAFKGSNLKGDVTVPYAVTNIGVGAFASVNTVNVQLTTNGYNGFNDGLSLGTNSGSVNYTAATLNESKAADIWFKWFDGRWYTMADFSRNSYEFKNDVTFNYQTNLFDKNAGTIAASAPDTSFARIPGATWTQPNYLDAVGTIYHKATGASYNIPMEIKNPMIDTNLDRYQQAPSGTFTVKNPVTGAETTPSPVNGIVYAEVGDTIILKGMNASTVEINGTSYKLNERDQYAWVTPDAGTYTVVFKNGNIVSRTYTVKVNASMNNYWINENFTVKNTVYGEELELSGAVAAHGEVQYLFGTSENGAFTATVPTEVGTYYAKASVPESKDFRGLTGKKVVKFSITQATNEWVKEPVFEDGAVAFEAKFGTDTAKVTYTNIEGKTFEELPEEPGKYNVTVSIPETKNYTGLEVKNMVITVAPKQTGWVKNDEGQWNYFDEEGDMVVSKYFEVDGFWFYVDADGVMQEGFVEVPAEACEDEADAGMHYFDPGTGTSHFGWLKKDGDWYYFDLETGVMDADVIINDPKASQYFYYLQEDGKMYAGDFFEFDGKDYYADQYGIIKKGWLNLGDGVWAYFDKDGVQVKGETVDGCEIDAEGFWHAA